MGNRSTGSERNWIVVLCLLRITIVCLFLATTFSPPICADAVAYKFTASGNVNYVVSQYIAEVHGNWSVTAELDQDGVGEATFEGDVIATLINGEEFGGEFTITGSVKYNFDQDKLESLDDSYYGPPKMENVDFAITEDEFSSSGDLVSRKKTIEIQRMKGDVSSFNLTKVQQTKLTVKVQNYSGKDLNSTIYLDGSYEGKSWGGEYTKSGLSAGSYEIKVKKEGYVQDTDTVYLSSGEHEEITLTLERQNEPPRATFSYSPAKPKTDQRIDFNSDSTDQNGSIDKYYWSFGDGSTSRRESPTHEFSQPGTYTVELKVTDDEGATDTASKEVKVKERNEELIVEVTDKSGESLDAEIYIDGNFKGDTGWDGKYTVTDLSPDSYSIRVEKEGYSSNSIRVHLSPGEQEEIALTLRKKNDPPTASFTFSPPSPNTNQTITFNSDSSDPEGTIDEYRWSFGDSSTSTSKNPTHSYDGPGTYEVKLTVTDEEGATDSTTKQVTVENRKPTAKFTYSPKEPKTGQQITFDATASTDEDGTVETYQWDLTGDGSTDKSGSEVTYTYDTEGTYRAKLTVTDNNGDSAFTTQEITITKKQEEEVDIEEKHALVVGITEYEYEGLNNLSFPAKDAKAFHDLLIEEGGFKEENVTLLTNEEATSYRFDAELRKLATETESEDLAVIYYSGHGVQGKDAKPLDEKDGYDEYYVTYNTDPTDSDTIYETGYRDDEFANRVRNITSDQIAIFLDSCYAGGATKTVKGYTLEGQKDFPANNDVFSDFDDLDGTALFAASKEDQRSYEPHTDELKEKLGHGVFTYYLLKGLKGEADKNNDGTITIEELRNYVTPSVEEFTEEHFPTAQTPEVKGAITAPLLQGEGKLEGEVKYVKGTQKDKADKGEYVVINLGAEDGVKLEDRFEVVYATKGVVIEKLRTEIVITDVVGSHLAVGKVVESGLTVEKGYRVRKDTK